MSFVLGNEVFDDLLAFLRTLDDPTRVPLDTVRKKTLVSTIFPSRSIISVADNFRED